MWWEEAQDIETQPLPRFPLGPTALALWIEHCPLRLQWWTIGCLVLWALLTGWTALSLISPVLDVAIPKLPKEARIVQGQLGGEWPDREVLANNTFFAIVMDSRSNPWLDEQADFTVHLLRRGISLTVLGFHVLWPYPTGVRWNLSRQIILPLWLAWKPHLQVLVPAGLILATGPLWWLESWILALGTGLFLKKRGLRRLALAFRAAHGIPAILWACGFLLYSVRQLLFPIFLFTLPLGWMVMFCLGLWTGWKLSRLTETEEESSLTNPFAPPRLDE